MGVFSKHDTHSFLDPLATMAHPTGIYCFIGKHLERAFSQCIPSASYLVVLPFPVGGSSKHGSCHLGIPSFVVPIGVHMDRIHFDVHMESKPHLARGPCTRGKFDFQEVAS